MTFGETTSSIDLDEMYAQKCVGCLEMNNEYFNLDTHISKD